MNIHLRGHSGCDITVVDTPEGLLVKKKATDRSYNQRLYAQYIKQKDYQSAVFRGTQVHSCFLEDDGLLAFTMDYISGRTLAEAMHTIELYKILPLGNRFAALLPEKIVPNSSANVVFKSKIDALEKSISGSGFQAEAAFRALRRFDWSGASESPCHGDLTLENIILEGDEIYLIDFLDSFYDSWAIDLAKILQDADLHWHYRYEENLENNLKIRLYCLKESVVNAILARQDGKWLYSTVYHVLLLNVLRIIPYCKDEVTREWISRQIENLLGMIEKL